MTSPILSLVVAVARNGAIGIDGGLPWRLPGDLAFFKKVTMGKPILMGRKTWESLPRKPLPGRPNLIVTRDPAYVAEGGAVFSDIDAALAHVGSVGEVAVIGGAELYRQTLDRADRIYLTEVDAAPDADTFFPEFDRTAWTETWSEPGPPAPDGPDYRFVLLERR